jgi:hypothetical protein
MAAVSCLSDACALSCRCRVDEAAASCSVLSSMATAQRRPRSSGSSRRSLFARVCCHSLSAARCSSELHVGASCSMLSYTDLLTECGVL